MDSVNEEDFKFVKSTITEDLDKNNCSLSYWNYVFIKIKKNKIALLSIFILLIISLIVLIGPNISGYEYNSTNAYLKNSFPNKAHWFGTDNLGRDLFARVCIGGRVSLIIAVVGAFVEIFIGIIYGGISGFFGGNVDLIMMRIVEVVISIPYLVVVILISLFVGRGIIALIIALTITGWCNIARLIRGQILKLKEMEYILAARALGASNFRIIFKHLLPNTIGTLIVNMTLDIPNFIFAEAFLSYIGLGIQSPQTSWGALASNSQGSLMFYPYQMFFPALFISLTMLSFNLLGDGLRDALDPKLR